MPRRPEVSDPARPRVKAFLPPPFPLFFSLLPRSTQLIPPVRKMLFTRLSLVALASALISTVSGLKIIAPGGSALWWGEYPLCADLIVS